MRNRLRPGLRLLAAIVVAVLTASLVATTGGTASAAVRHHRRLSFIPPQHVAYAGSTCTETSAGVWRVAFHWRVTGGRYANMGTGQRIRWHDNVYAGGARTVTFATTVTGWDGGGPDVAAPTTATAYYTQIVAPIRRKWDSASWRSRFRTRDVAVQCG